ncbi:MAG: DUF2225 domain-containing protein [Candidatus Lernaella stagnicola]|nr:DUF2225 domain-containing protein [Candidatus Lernaella stagnicola]
MTRTWLIVAAIFLLAISAAAQDPTPAPADATPPEPVVVKVLATPIELISPIDKGPVSGWRIDAFTTAGVDTDFCYLGASKSYYEKLIATDPRTGYTGYPGDFYPNLEKPLAPEVVKNIGKILPKEYNLGKLEPWDRYEILAKIYTWRGMPDKDIANAYLRATYTMRGLSLGENERKRVQKMRKLAIRHFKIAMDKADFKLSESPQLKYLIGDLYRRNGQFRKALRYYNDAAKMRNRPEWLEEMIIRQSARAHAYDDR